MDIDLTTINTSDVIALLSIAATIFVAYKANSDSKKKIEGRVSKKNELKIKFLKWSIITIPIILCIYSVYTFNQTSLKIIFTIISFCLLTFAILFNMIIYQSEKSMELHKIKADINKLMVKSIKDLTAINAESTNQISTIIDSVKDIIKKNEDDYSSTLKQVDNVKTELLSKIKKKKNK